MYSFAGKSNGFATADEDRQFGTSGVWGLDPPPLEEPKCKVLLRESNGFAMAMRTGNFGLRGSGT